MNGLRCLVIDGESWHWRYGSFHCVIWSPEGKKHLVFTASLVGLFPTDFERGQFKGTDDGMVKPSHVVMYIREQRCMLV